MNACDRPQAGTLSDSSLELMPSFGSNKMPPRPKEIVAAHEKYNKTEKWLPVENFKGHHDSIVPVWEIDPVRLAIIDSGCSSDTHPIDLANRKFPNTIHKLIEPIKFETVADPVICDKGATVKYGSCDVPRDVSLSLVSPSLISVGQRVMEAGISFFWLAGKQPCMITADYRYIVIFEINANVPVYAPCFERLNNAF